MDEIREVQATDVSAIIVDGEHAHVSVIGSERVTITMHRDVLERLGRQIHAALAKADYEENPQLGGG
jgi:hypothetical protein